MKLALTTIIISSLLGFGLYRDNLQNSDSKIDTIPCKEIEIKCTQPKGGNYVIRNEQEYHEYMQIRSSHPDCPSYTIPIIDFNQYTLLGVVADAGGCTYPDVAHYIVKPNNTDVYNFILKISNHGPCMKSYTIYVWCLIPRINNESKVEFQIEKNNQIK